jgi:hypothetical protein
MTTPRSPHHLALLLSDGGTEAHVAFVHGGGGEAGHFRFEQAT